MKIQFTPKKGIILSGFFTLLSAFMASAQGLINNGAHIIIGNGAYVYIDGGSGIGNLTNQDNGVFTGIIENQGFIDVTGDWTNLSAGNVFTASTGTTRLIGSNQFIQGTSSTYFNNLTLGGSGIKTLNYPTLTGGGFASPAGVLDLASLPLNLNGYKLTVNNPATSAIINTTGYIISETPAAINPSIIQWNMGATNGNYIYPFGVAGVQIPFVMNKNSGTGNVSVSTRATALANNSTWQASVTNMYSSVISGPGEIPVVIDRWWDVEPSAPVTAALSFTYRGSENTTTFNPTGTFSAQNWNSVQWLPPVGAGPGVVAGTATVMVPSQVLSSTPWVLSNLTAPLPVELLTFTAECINKNDISIEWTTASEYNNHYFTIEKSTDGKTFKFFAQVYSRGSQTQKQHYTYTDFRNEESGTLFFRLSQTNYDGKTEYFKPISLNDCIDVTHEIIQAWANGDFIHIIVKTPDNEGYQISLYDSRGRLLYNTSKEVLAGINEILLDRQKITAGLYFLNLKNHTVNMNCKIKLGE